MAESLTTIAVRAAKAEAGRRLEIPDGGSGLYLVVQPTGSKSWAIRYRHDGKPAKLTLGPVLILQGKEQEPEDEPRLGRPLTLKGARALAVGMLRQVARGIDPADEQRRVKAGPLPPTDLFETVAMEFIERYAKGANRQSSWRETARLLGFRPDPAAPAKLQRRPAAPGTFAGVAEHWGNRPIADIRRRDVVALLDAIADGGAPFSANRAFAALRRLFNWCVERDLLDASPCKGVKPPTTETTRERVLSDDEVALIWRACDVLGEPFGPFIKMLVLTGQRRDEVAEMTWSEVRSSERLWTLPRERAKNNTANDIPLSDLAMAVLTGLQRLKGRPDYVFTTGPGRRKAEGEQPALAPISGFSKAKLKIDAVVLRLRQEDATEAGLDAAEVTALEEWRFHDLRRTLATGMARLGIGLPVIEKVINHRSGSFAGVVGVYQRHSYADEKRFALQAWASHVEGLLSKPDSNVVTLQTGGR